MPALLVGYLDEVHPAGLVDVPVVLAAAHFRQQEVEGQKKRFQFLQNAGESALAYAESLHQHDRGNPVQGNLEEEFHNQDVGKKRVGEFSLGDDLVRLGSGDGPLASTMAGIDGLFSYMFFQHRPHFVVDLVGDFLDASEIPRFSADGAIHLLIRDFVDHLDHGKVGDLASVPLMPKPGAPLQCNIINAIVTIYLLILDCWLLFG